MIQNKKKFKVQESFLVGNFFSGKVYAFEKCI